MKRRKQPGAAGKPTKSRSPMLTGEDEALWEHVARGLEPAKRLKLRVPVVEVKSDGSPNSPAHDGRLHEHLADATRTKPRRVHDNRPLTEGQPLASRKAPPLAQFEKKRQRRIASGRMAIEARLDLHGMRQSDAHNRLRAFLLRAAEKGYSTVLVVTGKGGPGPQKPDDLASSFAEPERGVLRRSVPIWLEQAELRALVTSFTAAAIQHGGEGALYIHLRKFGART